MNEGTLEKNITVIRDSKDPCRKLAHVSDASLAAGLKAHVAPAQTFSLLTDIINEAAYRLARRTVTP